jgi:hypothetical protein
MLGARSGTILLILGLVADLPFLIFQELFVTEVLQDMMTLKGRIPAVVGSTNSTLAPP